MEERKREREKERKPFIDAVKGFAIICVILTHYRWGEYRRNVLLFPFWVHMAVPIFIMVTAYLTAVSYEKRKVPISRCYSPDEILRKFLRYTEPFMVMFLVQLVIEICVNGGVTLGSALSAFINGGFGEYGTYYYPMLLQMILLVPAVYFTVKKFKYGLAIFFLLNIIYEVLKTELKMTAGMYRVSVLRFLFVIAAGCWFGINEKHITKGRKMWLAAMFVFGTGWILAVNYFGYETKYFARWWKTSVLAAMYIIPLFIWGSIRLSEKRWPVLEKLGRASYNIFLVQILYYNYVNLKLTEYIPNFYVHIAVNVLVCVGMASLFTVWKAA